VCPRILHLLLRWVDKSWHVRCSTSDILVCLCINFSTCCCSSTTWSGITTPLGILHIVTFVTLCEAYMGIEPHFDLCNYFFRAWLRPGSDTEAAVWCLVQVWSRSILLLSNVQTTAWVAKSMVLSEERCRCVAPHIHGSLPRPST
jgi:hypothetical protein